MKGDSDNPNLQAALRKRGAMAEKKSRAAAGPRRGAGNAGEFKMYTDDAPGIQIGPSTVLILSLSFIGVVVFLHILGKLRGS